MATIGVDGMPLVNKCTNTAIVTIGRIVNAPNVPMTSIQTLLWAILTTIPELSYLLLPHRFRQEADSLSFEGNNLVSKFSFWRQWYITTHTIMHTTILNKNTQYRVFSWREEEEHASIYAIQYRHKLQKQISTEQKQAKNKRLMYLSNNKK
jgi:hypothetical protein